MTDKHDMIWEVPPGKEGFVNLRPDLTITNLSIHEYEERSDGSIIETYVSGDENVRRYLDKVKQDIKK